MKNLKTLLIALLILSLACICACNNKAEALPNDGIETPPITQNPSDDSTVDSSSPALDSTPDMQDKPSVEPKPEPEPEPEPEPQKITYVKSRVNSLAIRVSPNKSSTLLGRIDAGDMVLFIEQSGNWYKTYYLGKLAYISASKSYTALIDFDLADEKTESVILCATKLLGTKYVYGAERLHFGTGKINPSFTTSAFDCSSLVQYAYYYGANVFLGVTTRTQVLQGKTVERKALRRGDLMFFTNAKRKHLSGVERVGHVAIYLGNNYILHSASDFAVIEEISAIRWSYFITAKRHI